MERDGYEKIAYKVLESPKFWFYPDRIKVLAGLTYWTEVYKVIDVLQNKDFIAKARKYYESLAVKYPSETAKVALKNIKAIEEVMKLVPQTVPRCRVPATLHPYAPPARQFEDEMEKLFRSDPAEFYRRKKLVNQAIKERERGKIKALPDFSLTDLRRIKAHADSLYG